ncbi:MAG TPA: class I SAM-dependent methyltransferase [Methanotrichaceae archaeon]|nr:class I SAM-dependent methyltransferase [Methanotrichaceae archaeon]
MEISENSENEHIDKDKSTRGIKVQGNPTAMTVACIRWEESQKPEGERICYDPYAVHFISSDLLEWTARNPDKVKAMREQGDRILPGLQNSLVARVRFFDDFMESSLAKGLLQLVILGAGYDTRAYRIEELKGNVKVFEVDHHETQSLKREMIEKIFGKLPDHVVYVPVDFEAESMGQKLLESGYDKSKKTLFLMEGLLYYLSPSVVDGVLSFIVRSSCKGSSILFDYFPPSLTEGTSEAGRFLKISLEKSGTPFQFGLEERTVETFLTQRGFSQIHNVTCMDYKKAYFQGVNEGRTVSSLLNFVHAVIE